MHAGPRCLEAQCCTLLPRIRVQLCTVFEGPEAPLTQHLVGPSSAQGLLVVHVDQQGADALLACHDWHSLQQAILQLASAGSLDAAHVCFLASEPGMLPSAARCALRFVSLGGSERPWSVHLNR